MTTADQLLQAELPPRPAVLVALAEQMQSEEPDLTRVTELVSGDVGLAAAVIKTVNSPYFGLSRQVVSVQQAVSFLGLAEVFGIVTGALLRRSFVSNDPLMERLWDDSAARGALMRRLATDLRLLAPDRAYTCGLFEDSGMALLLAHAPGYAHTVAQAGDGAALIERERVRFGSDHALLGQALMRTWGLPEELALAVRHHHGLGDLQGVDLPVQSRHLVALSTMANAALSGNRAGWLTDCPVVAVVLDLPVGEVEQRFDQISGNLHAARS